MRRLIELGLIGGAPTIPGAWLGGSSTRRSGLSSSSALGAGAIAQVIVQILGQVADGRPVGRYLRSGPVMAGLATGVAVMYVTGMLLG